jgi:uncharacterized protein YidB (DUF937 family)
MNAPRPRRERANSRSTSIHCALTINLSPTADISRKRCIRGLLGVTRCHSKRSGVQAMQRSIQISNAYWSQSASDELLSAIIDFVQRHGTVRGLVARMEAMGLGSVARSWIDSNIPEPIFSEQLHALFGTGVLRAFAAKLDLSPRDLVRNLSQALPRVLNRLASTELRCERLG